MVSKKLAKWRSKSIKIDLKINVENYLKFSSKNVVGANWALGGGAYPISKDGSPLATRFADTGVRKTVRPHRTAELKKSESGKIAVAEFDIALPALKIAILKKILN